MNDAVEKYTLYSFIDKLINPTLIDKKSIQILLTSRN